MKFCSNCGAQCEDNVVFCPSCGNSFDPAKASAASADPFDHTAEFDPKDISDNKVIAMLCYLLGSIGVIIALLAANKSDYAAFHVRQALKFTVVNVLLGIVAMPLPLSFRSLLPSAWVSFRCSESSRSSRSAAARRRNPLSSVISSSSDKTKSKTTAGRQPFFIFGRSICCSFFPSYGRRYQGYACGCGCFWALLR